MQGCEPPFGENFAISSQATAPLGNVCISYFTDLREMKSCSREDYGDHKCIAA